MDPIITASLISAGTNLATTLMDNQNSSDQPTFNRSGLGQELGDYFKNHWDDEVDTYSGDINAKTSALTNQAANMAEAGYTGDLTTEAGEMETTLQDQIQGVLSGEKETGLSTEEQQAMWGQQKNQLDEEFEETMDQNMAVMNKRGLGSSSIMAGTRNDATENYMDSLTQAQNQILMQDAQMDQNARNNALGMAQNLAGMQNQRQANNIQRQMQNYQQQLSSVMQMGQYQDQQAQQDLTRKYNQWQNQQKRQQQKINNAMNYLSGYEQPIRSSQYQARMAEYRAGQQGKGQMLGQMTPLLANLPWDKILSGGSGGGS